MEKWWQQLQKVRHLDSKSPLSAAVDWAGLDVV
jgi:hypothetical protein